LTAKNDSSVEQPQALEQHPSYTESETEETKLHYGLGTFAWPLRIIWFGLACLSIYYVAMFYVPSLKAWMSWTPH
jgi:hypothetical protein